MNTPLAPRPSPLVPDLTADQAEDLAKLIAFFAHARTAFIAAASLDVMGLHLSARALVNLGALVPRTVGRWNDGYGPGRLLETHLKLRH